MKLDITTTLLELGDATSRNLEFSHRDDVWVSYGEETITETNLLEIRRQHPEFVYVRTFPKQVEAKNGADWEWHIIGRRRTLKMRVQAKRLQRNGVLRVKYEVKSSGEQQHKLLVSGACDDRMKAIYCIYCSEPQRKFWKEGNALPGYRSFQTGCLLADASDVLPTTRNLDKIEEQSIPWHHLFEPTVLMQEKSEHFVEETGGFVKFISIRQLRVPLVEAEETAVPSGGLGWNPPSIDDLNEDTGRDFDRTGVEETTEEDLARLEPDSDVGRGVSQSDGGRLRELGIYRMMVMDVRGDRAPEEKRERRRR